MKRPALYYALGLSAILLLTPVLSPQHPLPENNFLEEFPVSSIPEGLSTYENTIRSAAKDSGWDWRLIASIIYHESRFHNEAQSSKGATGLMQIRSSRYSQDTLLIPSVNIAIGTEYLKRLETMFPAASREDSLKFALAAYNLGDGNIRKLIAQADSAGLDSRYWELVAHMLPDGHRTPAYVNKVLRTYENYCARLPR
ncbi:MAG: transglycosylase SLT domain-containing protein [Bacteroidales bacterium]|jgi:membrane-bound lytic murein transglycosylase MltF|nr:transglycosylase SLT domain-containing protein [Bacteroidales bacterium]